MRQKTNGLRSSQPVFCSQTGFVREARLLLFLPFSHSTLWRKVRAKTFPAPVKISGRMTAWRAEDIHAWIEEQGAIARLADDPRFPHAARSNARERRRLALERLTLARCPERGGCLLESPEHRVCDPRGEAGRQHCLH